MAPLLNRCKFHLTADQRIASHHLHNCTPASNKLLTTHGPAAWPCKGHWHYCWHNTTNSDRQEWQPQNIQPLENASHEQNTEIDHTLLVHCSPCQCLVRGTICCSNGPVLVWGETSHTDLCPTVSLFAVCLCARCGTNPDDASDKASVDACPWPPGQGRTRSRTL